MSVEKAIATYQSSLKFMLAILNDFEEKDANFAPSEGAMTVVQQVRHTALTVEWFWEGAFGSGFSEDFEEFVTQTNKPSSLAEAIQFLKDVHQNCIDALQKLSAEDLQKPMPENNIMGPLPKETVIYACADHTAHHRGSLAVYLRLTGKTPKMIYGE